MPPATLQPPMNSTPRNATIELSVAQGITRLSETPDIVVIVVTAAMPRSRPMKLKIPMAP
jgi:hypothetical protein